MKYALLIGNSEYTDSALAQLVSPSKDVVALAEVLRAPEIGGFDEVTQLIDQKLAQVRRQIDVFFANKKRDDLLLVYYSGHGLLDERGELYLAVKDTQRRQLRATAISATFIKQEMDNCQSKRQVLILDCSYSSAFAREGAFGRQEKVRQTPVKVPLVETLTERAVEGSGCFILTASEAAQFALETEAGQSLFSRYLIMGLGSGEADLDQDGEITIDEWYDYTYEKVIQTAPQQTPGKWSYNQKGDLVIARAVKEKKSPKHRRVYDAQQGSNLPGILVREEGQPPTGDPAVDEAYDGMGICYDFFFDIFGRNSIDGQGMPLAASVHYQVSFDNAFWNGTQLVFGDGDEDMPETRRLFNRFTIGLDLLANQYSRGIINHSANLTYSGQSGALSESFSDVFGSLIKQWWLRQDVFGADWIMGAGLFTENVKAIGLRSLKAPGTAYDDPVMGKDPQPAHMDQYVNTTTDNGGVHINSGIPNHAFYLIAIEMGGYAWERAGKIWYITLRDKIQPKSDFQETAKFTMQTAGELYGEGSVEQYAVRGGWEAVGIHVTFEDLYETLFKGKHKEQLAEIERLGAQPSAVVVDLLQELLKRSAPDRTIIGRVQQRKEREKAEIRRAAARVLGRAKEHIPEALSTLAELAGGDPDDGVRKTAEAARAALEPALTRPSARVSRQEALARIKLTQAEMVDLAADAWFKSTSSKLDLNSLGGRTIRSRLGQGFEEHLRTLGPVRVGQAVVVDLEGQRARYLILAPTFDLDSDINRPTQETVTQALRAALGEVEKRSEIHALAIASIGTTWGSQFPLEIAPTVVQTVIDHLEQGSHLERVTFANPIEQVHAAYENAYQSLGGALAPAPDIPSSINERIGEFTGRAWLLPVLEEWVTRTDQRVFLLTGAPGTGKSMLTAWLAGAGQVPTDPEAMARMQNIRSWARAAYFCSASSGAISPKDFAKSIAQQLSRTIPGFDEALANTLSDQLRMEVNIEVGLNSGTVTGVRIDKLNLDDTDAETAFHRLLIEPLLRVYSGGYDEPFLIMIDALDESLAYSGNARLPELLDRLTRQLPRVRLLVTTRPDPRVLEVFRDARVFALDADPRSNEDVREFARAQVAESKDIQAQLEEEGIPSNELVSKVAETCGSNFLTAQILLRDLKSGKQTVRGYLAPPVRSSDFILEAFDHQSNEDTETFRVRVLSSPAGEMGEDVLVTIPARFRNLPRRLEFRYLNLQEMIALGETLASMLFPPAVRLLLDHSLALLNSGQNIRLRLRLPDTLANFPWEYAYLSSPDAPAEQKGKSGFIALDPRFSVTRSLPLPEVLSTPAISGPLHLAVAIALQTEGETLSVDPQQRAMISALQNVAGLEISVLSSPTIRDLHNLQGFTPHIFHFIGNVDLDLKPGSPDRVYLLMFNEHGETERISADQLAIILREQGTRLVVLEIHDRSQRYDIHTMSSIFTRAGIPAVICNQYYFQDTSAVIFYHNFYRALAAGEAVDAAVNLGRIAVTAQAPEDDRDFGAPVLYLSGADPLLFPRRAAQAPQQVLEVERAAPELATFPYLASLSVDPSPLLVGGEAVVIVELSPDGSVPPGEEARRLDIPAAEKDLNLVLHTPPGVEVLSGDVLSLPLEAVSAGAENLPRSVQRARFRISLRAGLGEGSIPASVRLEVEFLAASGLRRKIPIEVPVKELEPGEVLSSPAASAARPILPPDLTLEVQMVRSEKAGMLTYEYFLSGPLAPVEQARAYRSHPMPADWLEETRRHMAAVLELSSGCEGEEQRKLLAALGQNLAFQLGLTTSFWLLLSRARTLQVLAPEDAWLPWEWLFDGKRFLSETVVVARWPQKLAASRPYEFPVGDVCWSAAGALAANAGELRPWERLLQPSNAPPPHLLEEGLLAGIRASTALRGLHLVVSGPKPGAAEVFRPKLVETEGQEQALDQLAAGQAPELQHAHLNLHRERPMVALSYLDAGVTRLTRMEKTWAATFLPAGCSALIGPAWSVPPETDAAFWRGLYEALWSGRTLGEAFQFGQRLARAADPGSAGWLAYVLWGDPLARAYRPARSEGYTVVEAVGRELEDPLHAGDEVRFRISVRRVPPVWHADRLVEVAEELDFKDLHVNVIAHGLVATPGANVQLRRLGGDYMGWVSINVPPGLSETTVEAYFYFLEGQRMLNMIMLPLVVNGKGVGR